MKVMLFSTTTGKTAAGEKRIHQANPTHGQKVAGARWDVQGAVPRQSKKRKTN